jgi:hypothetical protein
MISRFTIGLAIAVLGMAFLAPSAPAQRRAMSASPAGHQVRSSSRLGERGEFGHRSQRGSSNTYGYLYSPYFFPDEDYLDYGPDTPEAYPVQQEYPVHTAIAETAPPAPAAMPAESLLLEYRDGQWVRIPTGNQMAILQSGKPDVAQASGPQRAGSSPTAAAPTQPELPHAIVVFLDGHMEDVGKYMIQGDTLFTNTDYWSTGSWTRKIPLSELDLPASLKLNKERGSKFNLPSGPNEVVVRF